MLSISAIRGILMAISRPAYQSSLRPQFLHTSSRTINDVFFIFPITHFLSSAWTV